MSRHHHLGFEEDNRQYYDNIGAIEMDSSQPLHLKWNSGAAPCLLLGLAEIAIKGDGDVPTVLLDGKTPNLTDVRSIEPY